MNLLKLFLTLAFATIMASGAFAQETFVVSIGPYKHFGQSDVNVLMAKFDANGKATDYADLLDAWYKTQNPKWEVRGPEHQLPFVVISNGPTNYVVSANYFYGLYWMSYDPVPNPIPFFPGFG